MSSVRVRGTKRIKVTTYEGLLTIGASMIRRKLWGWGL